VAKPRRSRRNLTLLVLVLVSLTVITIDESGHTHHLTSGIKSVANAIFSPLRSGLDDVLQPIGDFFAGAVHYQALQNENQKLEATIGRLRQQGTEQSAKAEELKELLAVNDLPFLDGTTTVLAQTTDLNSSNFASTIDINRGRDEGVAYGMPVVAAGGLIGIVIAAYHHSSIVQLITDGQSKVGVVFGTEFFAVIDGQGPGDPLEANFVSPGTHLHKGEVMFTNGQQGGEFPAGIPVARIVSFHTAPGASQIAVNVKPVADLNQLAYVDVVQWEPTP
jgi:rod shape-determining protein MreC